jgi:hypothetical protein
MQLVFALIARNEVGLWCSFCVGPMEDTNMGQQREGPQGLYSGRRHHHANPLLRMLVISTCYMQCLCHSNFSTLAVVVTTKFYCCCPVWSHSDEGHGRENLMRTVTDYIIVSFYSWSMPFAYWCEDEFVLCKSLPIDILHPSLIKDV